MMLKSMVVLSAAAMLSTTVLAVAKDELPRIDAEKYCRVRAQSSGEMMGDKSAAARAFETCMESENKSRDALAAAWNDIPPAYKASCIKPEVYSPSYLEWISCLELNIDVKILRTKK